MINPQTHNKWHTRFTQKPIPWLLLLATILLMILTTCLIMLVVEGSTSYSGKIVFQTHEEYQNFKQAISREDVHIISVDSLSSDPPIIVEFEIAVPHNHSFPYGNSKPSGAPFLVYGSIFGLCSVFLALITISAFRSKDKE